MHHPLTVHEARSVLLTLALWATLAAACLWCTGCATTPGECIVGHGAVADIPKTTDDRSRTTDRGTIVRSDEVAACDRGTLINFRHGLTSSAATFPRLRGGAKIRARLIGGEIVDGVVRVALE